MAAVERAQGQQPSEATGPVVLSHLSLNLSVGKSTL